MVFNIERFYPLISENLFIKAIQFAKQMNEISVEDINLIMQARKTLLFSEAISWVEKERNKDFHVSMSCFDGSEVCKLVVSYVLQQFFFLSEFSFTNIHDSKGSRGRERLFLSVFSTSSTGFTDTSTLTGQLLQRPHLCT